MIGRCWTCAASRRAAVAALEVLASLGFAGVAHAEELAPAKRLTLAVEGHIVEHCAMGAIDDMNFGDITRPNLVARARLQFQCNVPFTMTITSKNGGLANDQYPQGQGPYAGTLLYDVGVELPVRKPQAAMIVRQFGSRALMGGGAISSEGGIATDGMALKIALERPSGEAGLLAGNYSEVIEITVTPS